MRDESRARVFLGVLLLVSACLVMLDLRGSAAVGGLKTVVSSVVGPVESAAAAALSPLVGIAQSVTSFGDAEERERKASEDLQRIAAGSQDDKQLQAELQKLLKVSGVGGYTVLPARVVAYGTNQSFGGSITIDAGSRDGLETDMSVIAGDGLVGRVESVTPFTSTVELITDSESVVAARLESTRQSGALSGNGLPNRLTLKMLDPTVPMNVGDKVVTFGSPGGRPYAPGLPLGSISGFDGEQGQGDRVAYIRPAAALTALDVVGVVVVASRVDPREPVEPSETGATSAPPNSGSIHSPFAKARRIF